MVVLNHRSFTFEHFNAHSSLLISVCRKCLRLLRGNCSSTVNKIGHYSTNRFNTLRKRRYVQKQNLACRITSLAGQNSSLDSSSIGNSFVGVNSL
mmetsp:Transcript_14226/g.20748  ORF Transcript_14226/g.20748 Transcript_14226/m.20748 type:complete len:95 (-) Transcript_14226:1203-1487(-)